MTLTVRVIAPDKTVWDSEADEVILPSTSGQLGILTGHAPIISALDTGVLRVRAKGSQGWTAIALMGGFAEVDNNEVTILVNGAERGDAINLDEAKKALATAETRASKASAADKQEQLQSTQALKRARARLQAASSIAA
jgi:F-type H+-transporting ATPase subunit epsilon